MSKRYKQLYLKQLYDNKLADHYIVTISERLSWNSLIYISSEIVPFISDMITFKDDPQFITLVHYKYTSIVHYLTFYKGDIYPLKTFDLKKLLLYIFTFSFNTTSIPIDWIL